MASYKELYRAGASKSAVKYHRYLEGVLHVSVIGTRIVISKVTPRCHNRGPEYYLLSEKKKTDRKNQQKILEFSTFEGPPRRASVGAVWTPLSLCEFSIVIIVLSTNSIGFFFYFILFFGEVHSYSASQEFDHTLRNPQVHHRVCKNPLLIPVISHKIQSTLPPPPSRPSRFL